jgi:hypothetical protein
MLSFADADAAAPATLGVTLAHRQRYMLGDANMCKWGIPPFSPQPKNRKIID